MSGTCLQNSNEAVTVLWTRQRFQDVCFRRVDAADEAPVISGPAMEYIVEFGNGPIASPKQYLIKRLRIVDACTCATESLTPVQRVCTRHGLLVGVDGGLVGDTTGNRLVAGATVHQVPVSRSKAVAARRYYLERAQREFLTKRKADL